MSAPICTVIKVEYIYPPIPIRSFDYCAWYDGEEELHHYGYGETANTAVFDLLDNYPRE